MPRDEFRAAHKLALRGKSKEELTTLAGRFLPDEEVREADKLLLIEKLSRAASTNHPLAEELAQSEVAIKPSFYLMLMDTLGDDVPAADAGLEQLRSALGV